MGKRMKVLGKRRGMIIVTAAVLLLAVGAWVGSGANFSTSVASADNTFTAGIVDATPDNGMLLNLGPMAPGNTYSGTVQVQNSGNVAGNFYLSVTDIRNFENDGVTPTATDLASRLEVQVTPWAGAPSGWVALSSLTAVPGSDLLCGPLAVGASGTATVAVRMINGDLGGSRGADNAYQTLVTKVKLNWTVVSTPEG